MRSDLGGAARSPLPVAALSLGLRFGLLVLFVLGTRTAPTSSWFYFFPLIHWEHRTFMSWRVGRVQRACVHKCHQPPCPSGAGSSRHAVFASLAPLGREVCVRGFAAADCGRLWPAALGSQGLGESAGWSSAGGRGPGQVCCGAPSPPHQQGVLFPCRVPAARVPARKQALGSHQRCCNYARG